MVIRVRIPGKYCCVCGNSDPHISFQVRKQSVAPGERRFRYRKLTYSRTCRFALDTSLMVMLATPPNPTLGKRLSSPIKKKDPRAKRAKTRDETREIMQLYVSSRPVTPTANSSQQHAVLTTPIGDQLQSDHTVRELPTECASVSTSYAVDGDVVVDKVLLAFIEFRE